MFGVSKVVTLIVLVLLGRQVRAINGCRQCTGLKKMKFVDYLEHPEAVYLAVTSLKGCATGNVFVFKNVQAIKTSGCTFDGDSCKEWWFDMDIWRYCGNGKKVLLNKGYYCIANFCVETDNMELTCTKSVKCDGDCNCKDCGC